MDKSPDPKRPFDELDEVERQHIYERTAAWFREHGRPVPPSHHPRPLTPEQARIARILGYDPDALEQEKAPDV